MPLGIIGAGIYHVLTHPDDYFCPGADLLRDPLHLGGRHRHLRRAHRRRGRRLHRLPHRPASGSGAFADALAPGLLLAQAFGRLGNWFNHELFGLPTDLPWGLEIDATNPAFPAGLADGHAVPPDVPLRDHLEPARRRRHPVHRAQVPSGAGLARRPAGRRAPTGCSGARCSACTSSGTALGRSCFESIRIDPSEIFLGIRTNVWAALAAIVLGIVILVVQTRRHPGVEPSAYLPGREWKPDAAVDSDDTDSDTDDDDDGDGRREHQPRPPSHRPSTPPQAR